MLRGNDFIKTKVHLILLRGYEGITHLPLYVRPAGDLTFARFS
jgi:hypothetical protein